MWGHILCFNPCPQIETQKVDWQAESKVGSMDQIGHQAGGGDKKVQI